MRSHDLMWVLAVGVLVLGLAGPVGAQDAPVVAPDPAYQSLEKRLQAAEAKVKQLEAAKVQESQSVEKIQARYEEAFKAAKEQAGPGCRKAGGRLQVDIDAAGKIAVSCRW